MSITIPRIASDTSGGGVSTPQPLPTHGDGTPTPAGAPAGAPAATNWVLGTDYVDQVQARADNKWTARWFGMVPGAVVGGLAGGFGGYYLCKARGIPVQGSYGYMTDAAIGHLWTGLLGVATLGVVGGLLAANAINKSRHPITATYPERALAKAYTDDRLPMVLPPNLKVADVQGSNTSGSDTGTMQVFTAGTAKKAGSDREAAIRQARDQVLDTADRYDSNNGKLPKHQAVAVLQTVGGEYYVAAVSTEAAKDLSKRFDKYEVRSTDPALVALVTPAALYRA